MEINERILNDSEFICKLNLSELRLFKDGELDWFILVPLKEGLIEWCDLELEDQYTLTEEIDLLSKELKKLGYDKINIGSLGNMVAQLHIHVIGRRKSDRAWPGAIWGSQSEAEFDSSNISLWQTRISKAL
ncbi:conserved hypothetical protein [Halobacteriovorax marinus SJ]|uniref:HIT domain-containing protein n=1 Tax=Halobacteriovorax marinus (strain ATCC BAA-682 / DSM 15412 / SJ) TaxID=862908 RepID=E1WXN6_HALMS|nr:HIT family protein [Halobacteriovorax marinus]CBW25842.1 conserved hypothetical protein [Halobacteriovorax marinus SJ]